MPAHPHVDAATLQNVLQTVYVTGESAIIAPSSFVGELDTVVEEVKKYGMKVASIPRGGITILPAIPLSEEELFDYCVDYCKARTQQERSLVRHRISNRVFVPADSLGRGPLHPKPLYNPADYILRITHMCAELAYVSEDHFRMAYAVAPLLHINPVQEICRKLRCLAQSESLSLPVPVLHEKVEPMIPFDGFEPKGDKLPLHLNHFDNHSSKMDHHNTDVDYGDNNDNASGSGGNVDVQGINETELTGLEIVDSTVGPVAEYLSEKDYELVTESGIFRDRSGECILAIYVKNGIDKNVCRKAAAALESAATTKNMRKATNGGKSNPETGIVGYYDYLTNPTQRKCRETEFTRRNWSTLVDPCKAFLQKLNKLYSECAPQHYKLQRIAIPQHYQLFNTVFSTITVNRNFRTAVHTDKGDFRGGLGAVCVVDGIFDGCHLAIKKLGKSFRLDVGDVLFFDTSLEHGNTEVHSLDYCWKRVSVVCYLRRGLLSLPCELERRRELNEHLKKQLLYEESQEDVVNLNAVEQGLPPLYVPWKLVDMLSPIQEAALGFAVDRLSKGNGCIIALTMGLGKTLVALALCYSHLYNTGPKDILIVAPKTILTHWMREKEKWEQYGLLLPEFIVSDGTDSTSFDVSLKRYEQELSGGIPRTSHVFVVNPEYIKTLMRKLFGFRPSLMILDEGHRVSSKGNKLKDFLEGMQCSARVILSGTPVQNNAEELYRLIGWINSDVHSVLPPRIFAEYAASINRYIDGDNTAFSTAVSSQRYIQEWMSSYVFSVMKTDLPPLHDYIIICGFSAIQQKMIEDHLGSEILHASSGLRASEHRPYHLSTHPLCFLGFVTGIYKSLSGSHKGFGDTLEDDDEKDDVLHQYVLTDDDKALADDCLSLVNSGHMTEFASLSGKLIVLISILNAIREKKEKAIIFSQYVGSQDFISRTLTAFGIASSTIRGRDCHERRRRIIENFGDDDNPTCLVLSTQIGAYGLDFTAANHVILWDSWWNPQVESQAIARSYRRNQKRPVVVYRLASSYEDTIILKTQVRKMALFNFIMNEKTSRAVPSEELLDCTESEEDEERLHLWKLLKAIPLEGGEPAVLNVFRYSDTVKSESTL